MEPDKTRRVWITMLALADKNGEVQGSVPGLARMAGVDVEACRVALDCFLAPDPDSRTKDDEGRRIEEIDGGWLLLNHAKYRKMASKEEQIEKATARTRRYRESKARNVVSRDVYASSTPVHGNPTEAEAEAEAEVITTGRIERGGANAPRANEGEKLGQRGTRLSANWQPSADERGFAADLGIDPDATADAFRDYWVAVPGAKGRKLDWPATWRGWCRRETARPVGKGSVGRLQPTRGNDAFYQQLADIARRADD
jgi:hypothetical protein